MVRDQKAEPEIKNEIEKNRIEKRFLDAEKSYRQMEKEILPFLRRRRIWWYSTMGQWYDLGSLFQEAEQP